MMIGYFSVFFAFRCAMFYMSFLSHLLKNLSKRPAVEPSDFWENRTRFQKQCLFLFCIFTFAFFIFFHIFVNFRLPLPTPLAQIGLICDRFWSNLYRLLVDLYSFFVVFGIYANRFWMILDIKIQPFWNRVRFSIPYPPERPNAKHQVSNFGICQDLPESARSLPGSARNLPRISWSTIASTHLPHIHWPRNASQITNCQAPKRGGGGDQPRAAFN